jgi:hypothetical protein
VSWFYSYCKKSGMPQEAHSFHDMVSEDAFAVQALIISEDVGRPDPCVAGQQARLPLPPAALVWHKSDECADLGLYLALASAILGRPCKPEVSRLSVWPEIIALRASHLAWDASLLPSLRCGI